MWQGTVSEVSWHVGMSVGNDMPDVSLTVCTVYLDECVNVNWQSIFGVGVTVSRLRENTII